MQIEFGVFIFDNLTNKQIKSIRANILFCELVLQGERFPSVCTFNNQKISKFPSIFCKFKSTIASICVSLRIFDKMGTIGNTRRWKKEKTILQKMRDLEKSDGKMAL